jgi:AbiV family abortive infection protein
MREFDEGIRDTLAETRIRIAETAFNHVTTAIGVFESHSYSHSCFLAITAIEEMGKARTLQIVQGDVFEKFRPIKIYDGEIRNFLQNHSTKAIRAAASGLAANHGAVRRHGRHDEADLNLSSGILYLGKSGKWMNIRNACIYTDTNISGKSVYWPTDEISAHHAYYFICMALEVLAEESEAGFGSPLEQLSGVNQVTDFESATGFRRSMLELLYGFMSSYGDQFEPSNLEFFVEDSRQDDLRKEIREQEVRIEDKKRKRLREQLLEQVDDDIDRDQLPEGTTLEEYREPIIQEMVDTMMNAPYHTEQNSHPEWESLRKRVNEYVEYERVE